jgi:lipopolysaccharide/colanic/teichoic acid biosynthesis glycosyltransferase
MVLPQWFRKAAAKVARRKTPSYGSLLTVEDFRRQAARERVRADRNSLPFSILAIELPGDRSTHRDFIFLARVLDRRLRITDTSGFLEDGRVAVLLPETPKAGAWKVASDICDLYPVGRERPSCEVYIYPDESGPQADERQERGVHVPSDVTDQLGSLFLHPTPMIKRAVDVLGATFGLLIVAPFILLVGIVIKISSPGPVFYSQLREGYGGRRFRMYKLRSMCVDAHQLQSALRAFSVQDGPAFKMQHDPRTTWIGRLLRRTSLDELPQLWNVLVGDMTLVGPRPLPIEESMQCALWQRRRLAVVPGLTCIWQVRGRSTVSFEEWMRMDLEYLHHRSFIYDVRLLLGTIPSLVWKTGPR